MSTLFFLFLSLAQAGVVFFPGRGQNLVDDYQIDDKGEVQARQNSKVEASFKDSLPNASYIKTNYKVTHPDKVSNLEVLVDRKSKTLVKVVENWKDEITIANYDSKALPVDIVYCNRTAKDCLALDAGICDQFLKATGKKTWFDFAQEMKNCSDLSQKLNAAVQKGGSDVSGKMGRLFVTRVMDEQTAAFGENDPNVPIARQRNSHNPNILESWAIRKGGGNPDPYKSVFNISNYKVEDQLARGCFQIQKSRNTLEAGVTPARLHVDPAAGAR